MSDELHAVFMVFWVRHGNQFQAVHAKHAVRLHDGFNAARKLLDVVDLQQHQRTVVQFERRP